MLIELKDGGTVEKRFCTSSYRNFVPTVRKVVVPNDVVVLIPSCRYLSHSLLYFHFPRQSLEMLFLLLAARSSPSRWQAPWAVLGVFSRSNISSVVCGHETSSLAVSSGRTLTPMVAEPSNHISV